MQKKENKRKYIFIYSQCTNAVQNETHATWTINIEIGVVGHVFLHEIDTLTRFIVHR